jgi:hypothetical protein
MVHRRFEEERGAFAHLSSAKKFARQGQDFRRVPPNIRRVR